MDNRFEVTVGAGTMMAGSGAAARFPHRWTPGGVTVKADFTGGHLLHLAAAGCVLNDLYREAAALGIELKGVRVIAAGGFDTATWRSTGIDYSVEVSSDAPADQLAQLLEVVDQVAEIPQAIRAGATVRRVGLAPPSRPKVARADRRSPRCIRTFAEGLAPAQVRRLCSVAVPGFTIRPMTAADAHAVAAWRYPGEYSFYDADADPDDLAELLDPAEWGQRYFAAGQIAHHELAGFLVVKLTGQVAEIGLGLRPDLAGHGLGEPFLRACLRFASAALGAQSCTLVVAAFNRRAITVYERAGFQEVERFEHFTNGGFHAFIRMTRSTIEDPA